MEINKVLEMVAKELKENNKNSYVNRKDRIKEQKDNFFIQKNLEQSQSKPKSRFGKDDKVITDILKDVNNTISTVGLLTVSSINKGFSEQNKILKKMVKTNTGLGIKERYDPLSTGKEQREEKAFIEEKRTNEILEDILFSLGGNSIKNKETTSDSFLKNTLETMIGSALGPTLAKYIGPAISGLLMNPLTWTALAAGVGLWQGIKAIFTGQSDINNIVEGISKRLTGETLSDHIWNLSENIKEWLDFGWMKELEFVKKDWWIEKIDSLRDGISYALGLKDPPKIKPLEFKSSHIQNLQSSHGKDNKNNDDFEKRYLEYEGLVKEAAEKYGVSVDLMKTMMKVESGGDPLAKNKSGAKGLYQFVPYTAKAYGIVGQEFDPKANIDAAARLLRDNNNSLSAKGIEATDFNLYMAHQQGVGGLNSLYKALESGKVTEQMQQNMESNIGIKGITPKKFLSFWQDKFAKENNNVNTSSLTPIQESAKTSTMIEAKKNQFTSVNESQQPSVIGKIGNDITNIISNSTLNANFPYQSESKMKFAFGVA